MRTASPPRGHQCSLSPFQRRPGLNGRQLALPRSNLDVFLVIVTFLSRGREVDMRVFGGRVGRLVVLVSAVTIGCGSGSRDPNGMNGALKGFGFSSPSITALTPNSVPVNSVPFTMTVNGQNFGTDAIVFWNGTPVFTRFVSSEAVMADLTSTNLMFAGPAHVYVRSGGLNSNTVNFDVTVQ